MTEHSLWRLSRALQSAFDERQTEQLEAILDDDVEWAIYGPIDMFAFLGARRGKEAVLEVVRQMADVIQFQGSERESILLNEDAASSLMRYSITTANSTRQISLRLAQFVQFKAGRLVSLRAVIDTFDLVEQTLGRHIHLPKIA